MRNLKVSFMMLAVLAMLSFTGVKSFAADPDESMSVSEYLSSRDAIGQAQGVLYEQDYYYGPISERLSKGTRKALKKYQADHGLAVTGDFDIATARSMGLVRSSGLISDTLVTPMAPVVIER
jgi:peptidoglycan hydrolase-like protein with peptidoglycan-binding domain